MKCFTFFFLFQPEDIRARVLECIGKHLKDVDLKDIFTEPGERAIVCALPNRQGIMKTYGEIWECIHPEPEKLSEFNEKLKACMSEKARKEEEELMTKAG